MKFEQLFEEKINPDLINRIKNVLIGKSKYNYILIYDNDYKHKEFETNMEMKNFKEKNNIITKAEFQKLMKPKWFKGKLNSTTIKKEISFQYNMFR